MLTEYIELTNCPFCNNSAEYSLHPNREWFTLGCLNKECIGYELCPDWPISELLRTIKSWNNRGIDGS